MGIMQGIVSAIRALGSTPEQKDEAAALVKSQKLAKYFLSLVDTGEVQPVKEWDAARLAYEGESNDAKWRRTNTWRSNVDTQEAFLDEEPARLKVQPQEGFEDDAVAKAQANCEKALYRRLYEDLKWREVYRRMLHSAKLTGLGWIGVVQDIRQMLPTLRFYANEQVVVDRHCGGDLRRADWIAWFEMVTPETLVLERPELDLEKLRKAAVAVLDDPDERYVVGEEKNKRAKAKEIVDPTLAKCRLWRIFCRNAPALYDNEVPLGMTEADAEKGPHFERFRDRQGMNEPHRYVEVIEDYDEIVRDEDKWPEIYGLDYDEWPLIRLCYQEAHDRISGFSDYRHEKNLGEDYENAIAGMAVWMALHLEVVFGLPAGSKLNADEIKTILKQRGIKIIPEAFTGTGESCLKAIEIGKMDQPMFEWPTFLKDLIDSVSGIPKVKQADESKGETATFSRIQADAETARTNVRLRKFEDVQAEAADRVLSMAHQLLPQLSTVEVDNPTLGALDPLTGEPDMTPRKTLENIPWLQIDTFGNPDVIVPGVDTLVGSELALGWTGGPGSGLRQRIKVVVERGSTQRQQRLDRVAAFLDIFERLVVPILIQMGMSDKIIEAARKCLGMMDLAEFESILPQLVPTEQTPMMPVVEPGPGAQIPAGVAEPPQSLGGAG